MTTTAIALLDRELIMEPQNRDELRESALQIMGHKKHWSTAALGGNASPNRKVPKDRMDLHFKEEYATFVRPFPDYLEAIVKNCPVAHVRELLTENIEEERTGRYSQTEGHAKLFLKIPKAFGFDIREYEKINLCPAGKNYANFLYRASHLFEWGVGVGVLTIFVEGNSKDWQVFEPDKQDPSEPLENHPLVTGYDIPVEALELVRIHRQFDSAQGEHRVEAWNILLDYVSQDQWPTVIRAMLQALRFWHLWKDEVALRLGLIRDSNGGLPLLVK